MECIFIEFDNKHDVDRQAISTLHGRLLPHSPVTLLGPEFMREFYYKDLPDLGLIFGNMAYVDKEPVGFIVATHNPSKFMIEGIKKRWLKLLYLMAKTILLHPSRITSIFEAIRIMSKLPASAKKEKVGELLSLGVLPEYLKKMKNSNKQCNISKELVEKAVGQLIERKCFEVRAVVDENNLMAKMFYHGMGWTLDQEKVKGWKVPTVQFVRQCH